MRGELAFTSSLFALRQRAITVAPWLSVTGSAGLALTGIGRFAWQGHAPSGQWFLLPSVILSMAAVVMIAIQLRREGRATRAADHRACEIEHRYHGILDTSSDLTAIVDETGTITYVSPSISRLLGRAAGEFTGTHFVGLIAEQDRFHAGWLVACARSREDPPHTRLHIPTGLGDQRVFDVRASRNPGNDSIVINARDITEQVWLEQEQEKNQTRDPLTGLVNRSTFVARVDDAILRATRLRRAVTLAVIDLDHFSVVNDQAGSTIGDTVLRVVGERLAAIAGPSGAVGRLAGDRFGFLMEDSPLTQSVSVLQVARDALTRPVRVGERLIPIGASIGVTSRGDGQTGTTDALISEAEAALLAAQVAGPGQLIIFSPNMAIPDGRLELEADLRRAVEHQEFTVYYQPVVGLDGGHIVEMEALVRWNHPTRGLVAPGEFIPVAEETGLIVPIGWWVLEEACRQGVRWSEQSDAWPITMSVNLSPRMFRQGDLVHRIRAILADTAFPAAHLRLEITEGVMIEDRQHAATVLRSLKSMGVQLAIDDFGTGYSSLAYLQYFPVDVIKIDRTFIASMADSRESSEIVRSIVGLAKRLNLETTGEGIETADQLTQLRELGSDRGQGFLFSRPLPPGDLDRVIAERTALGMFAA